MKGFLTPLTPLLLLLLLPDGSLSINCPEDCSCSQPGRILCYQRHSSTIPRGLPQDTTELFLFSNGIEGLAAEHFDGLGELNMLDLSQNKLTELPDMVFEPLASLRNLDLSSNQITHISKESFHGMAMLERLYLYNNHIKSIHPEAFDGLGNLLELKLQGNQLNYIPTLAMPQLLLLDLRYNVLPTLGTSDLQTPNLESLVLANIGLTSIDDELIASLGNLHDLDISDNLLETFPPALKDARGLVRLILANNPMGPLKLEYLQNLENLQELDISSLSLQGLPEEFAQLFPHLNKLKVAENPFNCLCNLAWFPSWLRTQGIILERTEETRCHFPPIIAGKVLERLQHREFGCPTTTTVTTTTVRTSTSTPVPVTMLPSTTRAVLHPQPSDKSVNRVGDAVHVPVPTSPSIGGVDPAVESHFCPPSICINGGTCRLDRHGQVECACPRGTAGTFCEIRVHHPPSTPEVETSVATVTSDAPDISWREVTSTSIQLDLHRYIEMRPHIRGIRLTFRNLSGHDRRPMQLNLPASYPEYTLRGLNPNSTYSVCVSPLGAPSDVDSACTEAHTNELHRRERLEDKRLSTMLVPALAILLLLILIAAAVGVVCYRRRKRSKGHLDLECEPSPLELEGVKAGSDNGTLPQKKPELSLPEPVVQNSNLEYEVLLLQDHCMANNNKSSYF